MNSKNWITAPVDMGHATAEFRKCFSLDKKVARAEISVSAMGLYEAYINGKRLGTDVLTPGHTSYKNRIQYKTFDVTDMLKKDNKISVIGAEGWAVGRYGWYTHDKVFDSVYSVIAELKISFTDGTSKTIATNTSWDVYTYPVEFASIYNGETYNALHKVKYIGKAKKREIGSALIPQVGEDIREQERISPVELIITPKGEKVIDFGQNMTGYVEFRVKGKRGERICHTCAEVLDKDGNFYNENYRSAKNCVTYILDGKKDCYKPHFSFQGFRYIRLDEYVEGEIDLSAITAIAVYSEMRRTGYFKCGNDKINQLYSNAIWGQRSNYLDIPTDCPQRDERMGWTGDAQIFCRTGAINYDVKKFFTKWLGDMMLEQGADGAIAGIVPEINQTGEGRFITRTSAAWGDAATIIPWELYMAYGDKKLLASHFDMMRKWVEYIHNFGNEEFLWIGAHHYGDWLAMDAGEGIRMGATSADLIASAFFAHSTDLLIKAGEVLGKDMSEYKTLYKNIVKRFREYFMENGMPKKDVPIVFRTEQQVVIETLTQTSLILILHFNLCTEEERPAIINKLVEMIEAFGNRMSTGFVGTGYILHALSDNGRADVAYRLLFQEQNPSWLYSVNHGATTIWEHWDCVNDEGEFWHTSMNSFNHYAYGSVFAWIFKVPCGIQPTSPAYKTVKIAPVPCKQLGFAQYCIDTEGGRLLSKWCYQEDKIRYEYEIPAGTTAEIVLPDGSSRTVGAGNYVYFTKA